MTFFDWCHKCDEERCKSVTDSNEYSQYACHICGSVGQKYYYQKLIKKTWDEYFQK